MFLSEVNCDSFTLRLKTTDLKTPESAIQEMVGSSLFVFHLRKLMYIFQEMVDTETEYVKSLQYIMDVSTIFSILVFLSFFFVCCCLFVFSS